MMLKRTNAALGAAALLAVAATSQSVRAESASAIEQEVNAAEKICFADVAGCKVIASKAKGMLVFPEVTKAGLGVGGSYGVGALRVGDTTQGYYSTTSASIGLQAGAEKHSEIYMFLTDQALADFRASSGWKAGADASVAVFDDGASKSMDTFTEQHPVVVFLYGKEGLMGSLSVEGSKISPYTPE